MPVTIPSKYSEARAQLAIDEVKLGVGGLLLVSLSQIESAQVGYSVSQNGLSLCTGENGAWKPCWIVIEYDSACGDPLILDTSDSLLPVLHDFNGQGEWAPLPVSLSLEAFMASFKVFAKIAKDRNTAAERDANPVTTEERADFLSRIAERNNGEIDLDFWGALLEG